jgi:hypothetical protein
MISAMATETPPLKINKLDAAQRQLRTAITLWFTNGDPVSTHALAFAAYEVLHTVSKKRNKYRHDLLFDSDFIKDEYRSDWCIRLKKEAYFFKHADRDPDAEIEFDPEVSWGFLLYATFARELCGEPPSEKESAFLWLLQIHDPGMLTEKGHKFMMDHVQVEVRDYLRTIPKSQFFEAWYEARRVARLGGPKIGTPRVHVI